MQTASTRTGVLITRPEPGLSETVRQVAALGFDPVACPLLEILHRAPPMPEPATIQAILVTSGQALPPIAALDPAWRAIPLLAVGDATAARARDAGFHHVTSARGDAHDLALLVRAAVPAHGALLLATGGTHGLDLARTLRSTGYRVHRRVVYRTVPARALAAPGLQALQACSIGACLFYSAATARNFVRLCPVSLHRALGSVRALAMSAPVARELAVLPWRAIATAAHPDAAALLSLLAPATPSA